ncbi:choice-of-anchor Q domain-containing protein [Chloroflexota bacterium]
MGTANSNNEADTITLTANITLTGELTISSDNSNPANSITIEGSGYTIDANNNSRHFTVNADSTLNLDNVTLTGGKATFGGAILNYKSEVTVTNSTFSGNSARYGGAIDNFDFNATVFATVTVTNSTFSGNSATDYGGAIYNDGSVTVTNSIIAGGSCYGPIGDGVGNVITTASASCSDGTTTPVPDALLGPLQDNGGPTWTHALLPGSPAIDNPNATCVVSTDQRGYARPAATGCDSGAYEARKQLTVTLAGRGTGTVTSDVGGIDCGTACFASFGASTTVTLTASAAPGSLFAGWSGTGVSCGTAPTCTVLVEAEQTVTATFILPTEEESSGPEWGDPVLCDALTFVGGWGIFAEGTPEQTAYTVPDPPAGYAYVAQPYYDGYCDVFVINNDHSPLPVQVCWPVTNANIVAGLYHDQPDLSRTWTILPTTQQGQSVCAGLPALGGVVLLSGGPSVGTMIESPVGASGGMPENPINCTVTTTHRVNFRETPDGPAISRVPYETTLHATAESGGWFQVEWLGQQGWISGDYVMAVCE